MKYNEGVNTTMIQTKMIKRLSIFFLMIAGLLTLAACGSSDAIPYGSISDDAYLTIDGITVSEKELYDELRLQGASVLATMIDEIIFADEITAVKAILSNVNDPRYEEFSKYLDEQVNTAIHKITDLEDLADLYNDSPDVFEKNLATFIDSMYLLDNNIDVVELSNQLDALNPAYEGYSAIPTLLDRYALRAAQRYFALEQLEIDLADEESDVYIEDEDILTYYKNNDKDRYENEILMIRFINLNEANAALYAVSLKSNNKGLWFSIPDIRIPFGEPGYVDLADESAQGFRHVKTLLDNLGILDKLDSDDDLSNGNDYLDREAISIADYEDYYKGYTISETREDGKRDTPLLTLPDPASTEETSVLEKFVAVYNLLNATQLKVDKATGDILYADTDLPYDGTTTYDELTALNTTLRSHVYSTLVSLADMEDPEDLTAGKPYSNRVQTFGNSRYLVFKLDSDKELQDAVYSSDLDEFTEDAGVQAIKDEIIAELEEARLTSSYISTKVNELYEDVSVNIYDETIRTLYAQNYVYDGKDDNKSGDNVAKVDSTYITVDQLFARLEKSYGINLALDLASNKLLMASDKYSVTDDQMDDFKQQFEDIITQFSADSFASAGYPASMGRQKFLLTAFGATSNTEAINQLYVYPELRNQYLEDVELHYGETIYQKISDLAALQYDNFKSINTSHLLIYFDENGDGTPDNPDEYLENKNVAEIEAGLVNLVNKINMMVGNYKGFAEGLSAIATEFNNSGRILRGNGIVPENAEDPRLDYQIELDWAEYRKLGFYMKYEAISSAITNTSNIKLASATSILDEVFYDRAMALHAELTASEEDESLFPHFDVYDDVITIDFINDNLKSSFGYHLILATKVTDTTSAMYDAEDDPDGRYADAESGLNAYNPNSDKIIASQVEYYMAMQDSLEGVVLPTNVQTAVSNYLTPVMTRYNGTYMQRELIFMFLEDAVFANAASAARFDMIRLININQLNEYMIYTDYNNANATVVLDENYNALYGTWFDVLEA